MNSEFQENVHVVLRMQGNHHLIPMFTHSEDMPERVNRINPYFFTVFNAETQKYEVHSLEHNGWLPTREIVVPYAKLDARLERYLLKHSIRLHGKNVFRELEQIEQKNEASKKREFSNFVESVGKETREAFSGWKTVVARSKPQKVVKKNEVGSLSSNVGHLSPQ